MKVRYKDSSCRINKVETTDSKLCSRGGLLFILRYAESIKFFEMVESVLGGFRLSGKGKAVSYVVRQILAFFIDGTYKGISGFDVLREDSGYATTLEVEDKNLISSHTVKRFFRKFVVFTRSFLLRRILNTLFVWRLQLKQPKVIKLDMDTMVLDNDDAQNRQGVSPTYKNKKGFQPYQITWEGMVVDALFRRGSAHSNHGNDVQRSMKRLVNLIRKKYRKDVVIIATMDSGFLDEKNYCFFDQKLGILFIGYGKHYDGIKAYVEASDKGFFGRYDNGRAIWQYLEFGSRLKSWKKVGFLRTIYTHLACDEDGQMLLDLGRADSVLYTNIGSNQELTHPLKTFGYEEYLSCEKIIELAHARGASELTNRSLKEFMTSEHLPFKGFGMNAAYYYMILIAHLLHESYKQDVVAPVCPVIDENCYPSTFRRNLIDFAAKVVRTGNRTRFQVMHSLWKRLNLQELWGQCTKGVIIPVPLLQ